jgi:hypothetical protein
VHVGQYQAFLREFEPINRPSCVAAQKPRDEPSARQKHGAGGAGAICLACGRSKVPPTRPRTARHPRHCPAALANGCVGSRLFLAQAQGLSARFVAEDPTGFLGEEASRQCPTRPRKSHRVGGDGVARHRDLGMRCARPTLQRRFAQGIQATFLLTEEELIRTAARLRGGHDRILRMRAVLRSELHHSKISDIR